MQKLKQIFTKEYFIQELQSFFLTCYAVLLIESMPILLRLWEGEFTTTVLLALIYSVVRSVVKALLILIFPSIFKVPYLKNYER